MILDRQLDLKNIPRHVAVIMDGNGRWAKERGQIRLQGHLAGMEALREIVRHSQRLGVEYLTVYAFSTENWKRPADEVSGIFKLVVKYVNSELKELNENNVRVSILGDWSAIPKDSADSIRLALKTTENNDGLKFNIALNYGGRAEITRAVNKLMSEGRTSVTEDDISGALYTAGMPDPDVIIRTSGENRLSNFLIWQAAYSEIVLTDVYWPDFTPEEYERCIIEYQSRDRRFGGHK
ncbi:MAG: isoprenyl transferase [Firmicutes bacterium]|nr:isoprenyl transferase [Bacillota bacterium]MBQ3931881.1 isoprenyl transferase [Bacillota bacterium]